MKKTFIFISIILIFASCKKEEVSEAILTVNKKEIQINRGETVMLDVTTTGGKLTFKPTDDFYIDVSPAGIVTGKYIGNTTILVSNGDNSEVIKVFVVGNSWRITTDPIIDFTLKREEVAKRLQMKDLGIKIVDNYFDYLYFKSAFSFNAHSPYFLSYQTYVFKKEGVDYHFSYDKFPVGEFLGVDVHFRSRKDTILAGLLKEYCDDRFEFVEKDEKISQSYIHYYYKKKDVVITLIAPRDEYRTKDNPYIYDKLVFSTREKGYSGIYNDVWVKSKE